MDVLTFAKQVVDSLNKDGRRIRFIDMWTPFHDDRHTTAFPSQTWWFVNDAGIEIPDLEKIHHDGRQRPRRLTSIFAGENIADQINLKDLHITNISPSLIMYLLD